MNYVIIMMGKAHWTDDECACHFFIVLPSAPIGAAFLLIGGDGLQSDFDPMVYQFDRTIKVYPVGDLHIGAAECLLSAWEKFRRQLMSEPDSYITIGGDMMQNSTRSAVSNIFEETMRPREQKKWLSDQLIEVRDKILCIVPGNHEARSGKDADDAPLYDVACKLDLEDRYRENAAFLILRMGDKDGNGSLNPTYTACVTHSSGGGIYTGAAVNRNERFGMIVDGLDILITHHVHKGIITKPQKILFDPRNKKVTVKDFTCVSGTSWVEYGSYALRKGLQPASNTRQTLNLYRDRKQVEVVW